MPTPSEEGEQAKISDYILVRGDSSGNDVLRQVLNLKHAIDERFDMGMESFTDWAADVDDKDGVHKEILIGHTNREESVKINEELKNTYGYVIRSVGDKIVITASTTGLLEKAVARFTESYVVGTRDGILPRGINVIYKEEAPLCVMSNTDSMRLFVSEKASEELKGAVRDFSDRVKDLSGILPETVYDMHMEPEKVVVVLKDTVFTDSLEPPAGLPAAPGPDYWSIERKDDRIVLEGSNEAQSIAALGRLFEQIAGGADKTLDGKTVFFYEKTGTWKGSWENTAPCLVGGVYLGSEGISGNSRCHYYEGVSLNAYCAWKLFLTSEACGYSLKSGNATSSVFVLENGGVEISTYYNSDERTLMVIEQIG